MTDRRVYDRQGRPLRGLYWRPGSPDIWYKITDANGRAVRGSTETAAPERAWKVRERKVVEIHADKHLGAPDVGRLLRSSWTSSAVRRLPGRRKRVRPVRTKASVLDLEARSPHELSAIICHVAAALMAKLITAKERRRGSLTVNEVAQRLGMSTERVYSKAHAGRLPFAHRKGRTVQFSEGGLEEYMTRRRGKRS